jgi:hypothetical protein
MSHVGRRRETWPYQSSKRMFQLLLAWGLRLASAVVSRKEAPEDR